MKNESFPSKFVDFQKVIDKRDYNTNLEGSITHTPPEMLTDRIKEEHLLTLEEQDTNPAHYSL